MNLHPCVHKCVVSGGGKAREVYFVAAREDTDAGEVFWWPRGGKEYEGDSYLDSPYQYTDPMTANRVAAEYFGETPARRFVAWVHRLTGRVLGLSQ